MTLRVSEREASRAEHLAHIRSVHVALATLELVFVGGKVMALYAKSVGDRLRTTKDVDSLVLLAFGPRQRALLKLITDQVISPDASGPPCRHRLVGAELVVDLVDLDGHSTGGVNPYYRRAADACVEYDAGEGVIVRAITPPFFLLTKLVSLRAAERTNLSVEHHDAEDIVSLFVEVDDLVAQVARAGVLEDVQREFQQTFAALAVHDAIEFLEFWLQPDIPDRNRIEQDFLQLAAPVRP